MRKNFVEIGAIIALFLSICLALSLLAPGCGGGGGSPIAAGGAIGNAVTTATNNVNTGNTAVTSNTTPSDPINTAARQYVVLAWNDLGMHCLNPSYNELTILPPYNTIQAQVVRVGNPPQIVTSGLNVTYRVLNNTYSYGKLSYGQFWDNMQAMFGTTLPHDQGLNLLDASTHNSLSGNMLAKADYFTANGIPLTPVDDSLTWDPYQVAEITVRDAGGTVLAQTRTTIPTSDEISCGKAGCHNAPDPFINILQLHDRDRGTDHMHNMPILCVSCHGSPALGVNNPGDSGKYLSQAIHSFHATKGATCYDCHPGPTTKCSRSIKHAASDGNCITCHGTMAQVASSITSGSRLPWVNEPKCVSCHNVAGVDTGASLYRNSRGHGNLFCTGCHGSPHAMTPSNRASDNYQAIQYMNKSVSLGSCGACHAGSRGGGSDGFAVEHAGASPEIKTACNVCHTSISMTTASWPHAFQWQNRTH